MTIEIDIERPSATLPGSAQVAFERGRPSDRIAPAGLDGKRRWLFQELVRDRDTRRARRALVDGVVAELETGPIESVAFVVRTRARLKARRGSRADEKADARLRRP